MKRILLVLAIVLLTSSIAYAASEQDQNKLLTDALITAMNPLIQQAVTKYYGEPRSYDLWDAKILQLTREQPGGFGFILQVQVNTFVDAHNPPNALETVTTELAPSGGKVIGYEHHPY